MRLILIAGTILLITELACRDAPVGQSKGGGEQITPTHSFDAKSEGSEGWTDGDQHEFELSLSTTVKLGRVTDFDMTISGTAAITVLVAGSGKAALHLRLGKMALANRVGRHQQELDSAMAALAQAECFFDLSAGRLAELRLPTLSPIAVNTLRQIASMFQMAPGNAAQETEEFDTTGKYLASYGATAPDGSKVKRKLHYLGF
jgi:hypothetical protein